MTETAPLRALALVCSLKPSPAPSSSDLIARQVLEELAKHGVTGDVVRVVDHDVKPGVEVDMGDGDDWPAIREQLMAADILVVATPTWVGHMSSVAQRCWSGWTASCRRPTTPAAADHRQGRRDRGGGQRGRRAQDHRRPDAGAQRHRVHDPGQGGTYWNDEAMGSRDYLDLDETPEAVASTTATLAENAAHLARALKARPYPSS